MPAPIQTVNAFSEAELWYIYQQLIEINVNANDGLTQQQLYEVFNGTNPQGGASALFETLSGGDTPLANLLVETITGNNFSLSNVCQTYLNTIDSQTSDIASYTQNIQTNSLNTSNYLSTIRTPVIISTSASATISGQLHNISFYNSGSSAGTITVNGTTVNLPVGVTINYDGGGNNNRFPTNVFSYNATGTTFLISYVN